MNCIRISTCSPDDEGRQTRARKLKPEWGAASKNQTKPGEAKPGDTSILHSVIQLTPFARSKAFSDFRGEDSLSQGGKPLETPAAFFLQ
ncbi:MAG: hypothetical protein WCV99_11345, partial [Sterolibacterium sp.]|jgi:hypothetical protein